MPFGSTVLCLTRRQRTSLPRVPGLTFEVTRERAAAAKVGISQMEWAMADTGTLVQDAAPVERRLVSTLAQIHIALVPTAGLLPDMPSVLARFDREQTATSP